MKTTYETLVRHCRDNDLIIMEDPAHNRVEFPMHTRSLNASISLRLIGNLLQVLAESPIHAPEPNRRQMTETICRANQGLRAGSFDLDCQAGTVIFRQYAFLLDEEKANEWISRMVYIASMMLDQYVRAFVAVGYGNCSPQLAIKTAEERIQPDDEVEGESE